MTKNELEEEIKTLKKKVAELERKLRTLKNVSVFETEDAYYYI